MSDMDDIEQSIMTALRKAYQLGLDDALATSHPHHVLIIDRDKALARVKAMAEAVREWMKERWYEDDFEFRSLEAVIARAEVDNER